MFGFQEGRADPAVSWGLATHLLLGPLPFGWGLTLQNWGMYAKGEFYVFGCSYVGCIYIYNVDVFLVNSSLEYYEVTFWVSLLALLWKSILSDMSIATPAFFSCPFAWKICFQPAKGEF